MVKQKPLSVWIIRFTLQEVKASSREFTVSSTVSSLRTLSSGAERRSNYPLTNPISPDISKNTAEFAPLVLQFIITEPFLSLFSLSILFFFSYTHANICRVFKNRADFV